MWIRNWLARQMIGEDLKDARLKRKWSQRRLSRRSGISVRTISRIETGQGAVNMTSLILLALGLGETLDMYRSAFDASASALRTRRSASQKAADRFRRAR